MERQRFFLSFIAAFALVQSAAPAVGQAANSATNRVAGAAAAVDPVMPKDANAAMLLAARVNGLDSADMKPWHLKANYQTFDADGKPKDQGVFEEWWAGPEKWKVSYSDPDFHQVEYRSGDKDWITGDSGAVPVPESMVEQYLIHPLPKANVLHGQKFAQFDRKMGANTLRCFERTSPYQPGHVHINENAYVGLRAANAFGVGLMTCFDPKAPMVRVEIEDGDLCAVFDNVAQAKGQYIAEQIWVKNADLPIVHVNLDALDFPPAVGDSDIAAPASAVAVPNDQSPGLVHGHRIGGQDVRYPADARTRRQQETVIVEATINKTGDIDDLTVISGPPAFRQSAYDAVKTWKFKPFLLNGQPVEARIMVNVAYTPGG